MNLLDKLEFLEAEIFWRDAKYSLKGEASFSNIIDLLDAVIEKAQEALETSQIEKPLTLAQKTIAAFSIVKASSLRTLQRCFPRRPSDIHVFEETEGRSNNYCLQTLLLDESVSAQRDVNLETTNAFGIMTHPVWKPLHTLAPYCDCPCAQLPVAESLERRIINLPSSAWLV